MIRLVLLAILVVGVGVGIAFAGLYSQVPRYKNYWQRRAAKPMPDNALVYVAMGDSTAQGIGASSPDKGYVGLIAKALQEQEGRPVHVINLSKSGARVQDCLREQLPQLQNLHPDVITLEIGANDMSQWDEDSFKKDMNELLSQLPKQTVVSDIPYFGGGRKRRLEPQVLAASRIISELAQEYALRVAPLYQVTKEHDSVRTMTIDFLHPSNKGYQNWYAAFWQPLQTGVH